MNFMVPTNYSAEFIFPDFLGQNELFSLINFFTWNTNVGFQYETDSELVCRV